MIEFSHVSKLFGAQKPLTISISNFQEGEFFGADWHIWLRQIHHPEND